MVLSEGIWKCGNGLFGIGADPVSRAFGELGQGIMEVLQHKTVPREEKWPWSILKCQRCPLGGTQAQDKISGNVKGKG